MSDNHSGLATLAQNIKLGIDNRLKELHTALPGIIQSFDPELQTVSVQPAIKRIFKSISEDSQELIAMELPILINVPILYPRGGGFSLTFPISVGDECLLLFSERSIDRWHIFGGTNEPGAKRFHSLSDGISCWTQKNQNVPFFYFFYWYFLTKISKLSGSSRDFESKIGRAHV